MSLAISARSLTLAVAIGVAGTCLALPALAAAPVSVTFNDHNPWAQEVGSVNRDENSLDYTVAIAGGKTMQLNLVTRNPNVFFKVKDDTHGKQLIDTYNTGASTWSTAVAVPTTYTIQVYIQRGAVQRDEKVDYALQIGQYGAADMQAATTTVDFAGKPWAQDSSSLDAKATAHDYAVTAATGQTLAVNLVTKSPKVHFKVSGPAGGAALVDSATSGNDKWSMPVTSAGQYIVSVYADPAGLPPGTKAGYVVQIGLYSQPAAGSSTAPAPGATTAPAAAATSGQ